MTAARGTTYIWNGAASNDWFTAANWTPAGTPGALDTAVITNGSAVVGAGTSVGSVTLGGSAALYATAGLGVSGQFHWTGGSVAGQLTMETGATLTLNDPGGSLSLAGATIINKGTAVWNGGALNCNSNTIVTNSGQWLAETDDQFLSSGGPGAVFYNLGAFTKSPSSNTSAFLGVALDNSGAVNVDTGALVVGSGGMLGGTFQAGSNADIQFSAGGLLSGVFTAAPGASVTLTGGAFTNDKAVFSGPGAASMTGGTLLLSNDVSQNLLLAGGTVMLGPQFQQNGGITNLTIAGATLAGANTVLGTLNWTGGAVSNALTVAQNGVVYLSGSADLHLHAALTNAGHIIWNGASNWHLDNDTGTNGGWINNLATGVIDAQCDQTMYADFGGEWFNNAGLFQKSMGANATVVQEAFTNTGIVQVLTGSMDFYGGSFGGLFLETNGTALNLENGGVLSGTFSAGFGAVIDLAAGAFTQTPSVAFGGAGLCEQTGGTLTLLNGSIPNLQLNGGTLDLAPGFEGGTIHDLTVTNEALAGTNTVTGVLSLNGATGSATGALSVAGGAVLNVNGATLSGPLVVNAGGTVNWSGGTAQSWVNVASNGVLNITGNFDISGAMLTNAGTVDWDGGYVQLLSGAGIYNLAGAVFDIVQPSSQSVTLYDYGGNGFFSNAGLLQVTASNGAVQFDTYLANSGAVRMQGGTIVFDSGGALAGAFMAANNATIDFDGSSSATYSYDPAVVFGGAGTNEMTGGSLTLVSNVIPNLRLLGGTLALGPAFQGGTITNLNLGAVNLVGTNVLTGVLTLNRGNLTSGALFLSPFSTFNFCGTLSEPLTVPSNAVLNLTGTSGTVLESSLTNEGTINWAGGDIYIYSATIDNLAGAVFSAQTGGTMYAYYAGSTFNNAGLFMLTNTNATVSLELPLNNLGRVYAYSGTLIIYSSFYINTPSLLAGTFQAWPGGTIEFQNGGFLSGTFTASLGGVMEFASGVFSNSASALFNGGGSNLLAGGSLTLTSNIIPNLQYQSGTVILSPQFQGGSITNLTLTGAGLTGTNTVTGVLTLDGGSVAGSLTIASNGVLNIIGPNTLYVSCPMTNAGTINWEGGTIYLATTNNFENLAGAAFNVECNQFIELDAYPATALFVNAGSITKSGLAGSTYFEMPLANSGTVNVQTGLLYLEEGGPLGGVFATAAGGQLLLSGGSFSNTAAPVRFTGAGSNSLSGGDLYLPANTLPGLQLEGGTIYPGPAFQGGTITNLALNGVSLAGTNTVTGLLQLNGYTYVEGPLNLAAGSVLNCGGASFYGPLAIASGAVLNLAGPYESLFDYPVTNQGTIHWTGGMMEIYGPFYNLSNAVLSVQCDQEAYANNQPFYNSGLILKTNATGFTTFYPSIVNTGTVDAESGVLYLEQPAGLIGGLWAVGLNSASQYGAFAFQSSAVLTNTLHVNLNNGFQLAPGNAFTLVTYGSETGTFLPPVIQPPQGAKVSYNYGSRALTLTVNSVNAPVITILSPTNDQTFTAGGSIPITVSYTDTNATVIQLQYFQGHTLIGSGSNFTWSGVASGFYTLTAKAVDGAGSAAVSAPVNILVQSNKGASYTWTGASSADWSVAGNWQPPGPPGAADNAFILGGPAVNLDINPTVNNVILSGGALSGGGTLTVTNGFNWTGGVLGAPLAIGPAGTIYLDSTNTLNVSNATLVNLGTMRWTSGDLLGIGATTISNAGHCLVQAGANLSCSIYLINTGSIQNGGGAVSFTGGGLLDGSMSAALAATNNLGNGSFEYGASGTFAGPGSNFFAGGALLLSNNLSSNLVLAGGTVTLGPAFQNGGAITNLTLAGATLVGSNLVTGALNWVAGEVTGQLAIAPGGLLRFSGASAKIPAFLTLLNQGEVDWLGGSLFGSSVTITNDALWLMESDDTLEPTPLTFVNNGTVRKINSSNTSSLLASTFLNNGTIDAESGIITIQGASSMEGEYNTATNAAIEFQNGNLTLGQAPAISGSGSVALTGTATATILSNVPAGFYLTGGSVVLGPDFQAHGVITNLTLNGAALLGNYTVSGVFQWLSGTIGGSLTVASNATLSINGTSGHYLNNGGLTNFGSVLWSNATIFPEAGAIFVNNGLWLAQSDSSIEAYYYGTGGTPFINNGLFRKLGTTGYTYLSGVTFTNFGTVDAEMGVIDFEGGGGIGGAYQAASSADIYFSGGIFTPIGSPTFAGNGTIDFNGGTLDLVNDQVPGLPMTGGTIHLGAAFQNAGAITNLTLSGSTLTGPCVVTGTLNWFSGSISGPLTIASNGTLNLPPTATYVTLNSGALTNFGTVNWGAGSLYAGSQALIVNDGLWLAQADNQTIYAYYYYYEYPQAGFINNGIFRKQNTAGSSSIQIGFTNNGLVDVESGSLIFYDGGMVAGAYQAAAGAAVELNGGYFTNAAPVAFTGAGAVSLQGAYLTLTSDQVPGLQLDSGYLMLGPAFQNNGAISNLTLDGSGMTLQGTNTVTGTFNWNGGDITGSLTVAANGLLSIAGPNYKNLGYGAFLNNSGTVAWSGGQLSGYYYANNGSFITNNGLWLAQCDNGLQSLTFINTGTFRKALTSGATTISGVAFINSGTLDAESGLINFNAVSNYAQTVATLAFGVPAPKLAGQLTLTGGVNLDGTLAVNLLDGYTPIAGDAFTLMTYGSKAGAFAQFNLPPLAGGLNWETDVGATSVSLRVVQALSNDNTLSLTGTVTDSSHHPIGGVTVYAAAFSTGASNLIQNGSFESPSIGGSAYVVYSTGSTNIPGWTVTGPAGSDVALVSHYWNNEAAEDGAQYFDPTGDTAGAGGISQTFPTVAGAAYVLVFYHGTYNHHGLNAALGVDLDGQAYTFGESSGGANGLDWRQVVIPFTASSNFTTLSFANLTGGNTDDIFVDNVQVFPPDSGRVLQAVTDAGGNYQISLANGTFVVDVAGLAAAGYNDVAGQSVTLSGGNQTASFVATPLSTAAQVLITTAANPANAGTTGGGGSFTNGSAVTVSALATNATLPYHFANWTENGVVVSLNANYTFVAVASRHLVANFVLPAYTISASNNPALAGSVSGAATALWGSTVVLQATPAFGYAFANWTLGGSVVGTSSSLSIIVLTNQTYVANYIATNLTHVVTVATSPPGVAAVSGAGTYANGQTAVIKTPMFVSKSPDLYTFQYYTINGAVVTSSTNLSVVMSTLVAPLLQCVAVYNAQSILPLLASVTANYASPVPATSNFMLRLQFDRTMNTAVTPTILLTNAAPNAVQPVVRTSGRWTGTSYANDTYLTPNIIFGPGMDGTVQVFVSGAQDLAGDKLALTNAINLTVRSTPPVPVVSSPANGASFTTTNTFTFAAGASSIYGISNLALYANGSNQLASVAATNISLPVSGLSAGSYRLTAVATDAAGLSATSAVVHVTINIPGTTLIDFEALDASAGPVSGGSLSAYLAGYGVAVTNVTTNTALAVQNDQNILGGEVTAASSGDNLLTQIGANGAISYTLVFSPPYPSVSWTRTALLAGTGGVETPAWQATAYDSNGAQIGSVGERQIGSFTNVPARKFTLGGANIRSITFAGNNSFGALNTLPLDDLLLSTFAPGAAISVSLSDAGSSLAAPGQIQLTAQASDTAGSIVEIDFYQGQALLGSVLAGPAGSLTQAIFNLTNIAAGSYTFTAVATDGSGAVRSSAALPVTVTPAAGVNVINFDALNTSSGTVGGALLSNYLAGFGVRLDNVTLGTRLEAVNGNNLSGNAVAVPSSPPNLFTQVGLNQPVTFSLELGAPAGSFGFTRVALTAGPAGISHPAWTAHAFNAAGTELESVGEPLIYSFGSVPARTFQLTGKGITRVRFDSDSEQTAAFSAVLLDDLVLDTNAAANALSITLAQPSGTLTAPATLTLSATVSDALGAVSSVAFYAGPNLIGTALGGSPAITWSNVLAGTYVLTAQAMDSLGYARISSPVTVTVQPGQGNSTLVNFDALSAAKGPVTGAALSNYLFGYGLALSGVTAGTQVAVENQGVLAGGGFVAASSPPNLLTQIGGNGPAGFTVQISNWLASFTFTRPQLLAHPFVTHPAWQAMAFDALGVPLAQAGEGLISSFTNVPAQTFTLQAAGIASVAFESQGSSLNTFQAALLDDFILTVSSSNLPPAVVLTNPQAGQVFTTPALIPVAAEALEARGTVAGVSFYANGGLIGQAASSPFLIYWTNPVAGLYELTAVAADGAGLSRTSPPVNVTVNPPPTVFGILTQPVGATVAVGGSVIFSVQTTGTNTVTYQWYQDSKLLPGQTQPVLSLNPVSEASAGTYTVVATSGGQSLTSQGAVLTVLQAPVIATPPLSQQVNIGDNVTLTVGATGSGPFSYQWILNGTGIGGATDSTYTLAAVQPLNSGNYQVIVGNLVGFTQSPVAAVTVTVAGGQTLSADNFSNRISFDPLVGPVFGNNTGASLEAGEPLPDGKPGGKSIWYTWHASFDGVISLTTRGSSFDTLLAVYTGTNVADLTPVAADDDSGGFFTSLVTFNCVAGIDYQIDVDGFQGASGTVVLGLPSGTAYRVLNPSSGDALPVITKQPTNQLIASGATATLAVAATSSSPLTYQWFFQNAPVAGASASHLAVSNFQSGSVGNYDVLVANGVGSVQSATAILQLGGQSQTAGPADTTEDKFGDAVDLSKPGGQTPHRLRPEDGGGDTAGYSVSQTFNTVGATKEAGEPNHCGQAGGASEWYLYTTPAAGTLHVDTSGSDFNTILGIYTNAGPVVAFSNLVEQGCGYTTNYQKDGQPSINLAGVAARTTYYIVADGYNGASGVARLNIGLGVAPQIVTQPQSRPGVPGGSATFSVVAAGTTNFSYQWRFDEAGIAGATNSSYTLTNIQNTAAGSYSVVVSNVVDVVTSAPALLTLQSAPFILAPPASQTVLVGKTAGFSVAAGGGAPLSYQWYFNGAPIAKASGATLAVGAAKSGSAGNYNVVVKNSSGSVTSAVAVLTISENTKPTLTVSYPAGNITTNNSSITLRGTAGDVLGVTSVQLVVNSNLLQNAIGTTNWSAVVTLAPGTNRVTVQSYNVAGLASTPVSRTIFYAVLLPITLQTNGSGKIAGQTNKAPLQIGRGYTVTATPAPNFLFSNWTGGTLLGNFTVQGIKPALSFIMATNLTLQANFVTNPFPAVAGTYNGLFYPDSGITEESSGAMTLTFAGSQGGYTAKISLAGIAPSFTGTFDLTGNSQAALTGPGQELVAVNLHVNLNLNPPDNQITGFVSASGWQSRLTADRAVFNGTTVKATNYAARYTLIVPPGPGAPQASPGGYGLATITNNLAGVATVIGSLGDGTAINHAFPISGGGVIPVYISLYTGRGSLLGWITFTNVPPQTLFGALNWIKPSGASKPFYPGGFTNQTEVVASIYKPPASGGSVLNLSNATLTIAGGGLGQPLVYTNVTVAGGKLSTSGAGDPTNQVSAAFTAGTGAMTLTFRPTGAKASVTAQGVVLQQSGTNAAGWFPGTNESGYFLLQP